MTICQATSGIKKSVGSRKDVKIIKNERIYEFEWPQISCVEHAKVFA
jgi:hypothetical protein